jgi:signal recognition particle subunit SEC65
MPRMQILSPAEQRAFDTPPLMNAAQRKAAFDLPVAFQSETEQLRDPVHKIGFYLNAGYFRRSRRCFAAESFQVRDIGFVASQLGYEAAIFETSAYPIRTRQRHERTIERLSGFRPLDTAGEARLVLLIEQKVTAHEKPKIIFYAALEHLAADRSISPSYRSLQDLILGAIARFRARQLALIAKHMTTHIASALEALLGEDDGPEAVKRHRLTILKQNTQSVRPTVIKARVANHADLAKLFHQVEPIVAVLGWDVNSMRS